MALATALDKDSFNFLNFDIAAFLFDVFSGTDSSSGCSNGSRFGLSSKVGSASNSDSKLGSSTGDEIGSDSNSGSRVESFSGLDVCSNSGSNSVSSIGSVVGSFSVGCSIGSSLIPQISLLILRKNCHISMYMFVPFFDYN